MTVLKSITVENGQLVIINDATTTRIAAGVLTDQLVPLVARPLLDADEMAALELLGLPYVGLIVRARDVPEVPDEGLQQVQDREADE